MMPITPSGAYSMRARLCTNTPEGSALALQELLAVGDGPARLLHHRPDFTEHGVVAGLARVARHDLTQLVGVSQHVVEKRPMTLRRSSNEVLAQMP